MIFHWYALYVRSNHESKVRALLERKDITCFLPLLKTWSRRKDRRRRLQLPMFRGYVFVHVHLDNYMNVAILKSPGAITLLRNSEGALSIPDHQVESLQAMVGSNLPLQVFSSLHEGDRVKVVRGLLTGCVGTLERIDHRKGRLFVSVAILGQSVSVEVNAEDCEPA